MIVAFIVLIPLLIIMIWGFFRTSPKINSNNIKIYNSVTIISAIALSIAYSLKLRFSMINSSDFGWWPVLSFMFSLSMSIGIIFVSGIIRNLLIFRNKKR